MRKRKYKKSFIALKDMKFNFKKKKEPIIWPTTAKKTFTNTYLLIWPTTAKKTFTNTYLLTVYNENR
jgi:GTP-sensing pleiotropic transcriptional regulator CodY